MDNLEQIVKSYTANLKQEILNMLVTELPKKIRFSIGSSLTGLMLRYQRAILEKPISTERLDIDEDEIRYVLSRVAKKRVLSFGFDELEDKAFVMALSRDDGHGEDASAVLSDSTGKLKGVIVCDGVSESKGKFAAQYMVNAFVRGFQDYIYKDDPEELETFLDELLYESARRMMQEAARRGVETSSTTLLVGLTDGKRLYLYYLGDGFIYYYNHETERIMPYMIRYKKGLLLAGFVSVKSGVVSRPVFLTIENTSPEGDILVITTDGVMLSPQEDRDRYKMFSRMVKFIASRGEDPIKLFAYLLATIGEDAPDDATIGVIGIKPKKVKIRFDYKDKIEDIIKNPPTILVRRKQKTTKKPWEIESSVQQRRSLQTPSPSTPWGQQRPYREPIRTFTETQKAILDEGKKVRTLAVSVFIMGDVLDRLYNKIYEIGKFSSDRYLEIFLIRLIDSLKKNGLDAGFEKVIFFVDRIYPYRPKNCLKNSVCLSDLSGFEGLNKKMSIDREGLLDVLNKNKYRRMAYRLFKAANVFSGIKAMAEAMNTDMAFLFIVIGTENDLMKVEAPVFWAFKQLVFSKIKTLLLVIEPKNLRDITSELRSNIDEGSMLFDRYISIRKIDWIQLEAFSRKGGGTVELMIRTYIPGVNVRGSRVF